MHVVKRGMLVSLWSKMVKARTGDLKTVYCFLLLIASVHNDLNSLQATFEKNNRHWYYKSLEHSLELCIQKPPRWPGG